MPLYVMIRERSVPTPPVERETASMASRCLGSGSTGRWNTQDCVRSRLSRRRPSHRTVVRDVVGLYFSSRSRPSSKRSRMRCVYTFAVKVGLL